PPTLPRFPCPTLFRSLRVVGHVVRLALLHEPDDQRQDDADAKKGRQVSEHDKQLVVAGTRGGVRGGGSRLRVWGVRGFHGGCWGDRKSTRLNSSHVKI